MFKSMRFYKPVVTRLRALMKCWGDKLAAVQDA